MWRFRRPRGWLAAVMAGLWLVLAAPGQGVEAASLEGFGSIKFGMTEDEAWAAIDGAGEWYRRKWPRETWLHYDVQLKKDDPPGRVSLYFEDGRAEFFRITFGRSADPGDCIGYGRRITRWIAERHGVSPITRTLRGEALGIMYILGPTDRDIINEEHFFGFEGGAYISVWIFSYFALGETTGGCDTTIHYIPPALTSAPF